MPHGQLSQHQPDGVETVLVKPGRCVAEPTDTLVVLRKALGGRARLAAGFHPQGRVSGRLRRRPPELGGLRRWRFQIRPLCPLPLDAVIKNHLNCHFMLSRSVVSDSWDPTDCSPPGVPVHGILQARTLEELPCPPLGIVLTRMEPILYVSCIGRTCSLSPVAPGKPILPPPLGSVAHTPNLV